MDKAVSSVKSTTLKWNIRLFLGILTVAFTVLIWRIFAGTVQQRFASPDRSVMAEVRQYNFRAATDAAETAVQIGTPFHRSHTVFDGLNYGAEIKIAWIDSRTLLVRCGSCNNFHTISKEEHWGPISIQYEID